MTHDPALIDAIAAIDAIDDERAERAALARELDADARAAALEDDSMAAADAIADGVGGPPVYDRRSF